MRLQACDATRIPQFYTVELVRIKHHRPLTTGNTRNTAEPKQGAEHSRNKDNDLIDRSVNLTDRRIYGILLADYPA